jgi:hypothetical protein
LHADVLFGDPIFDLLPGFVEAQAGDGLWAGLGKADGAVPGDGQFQLLVFFAPELDP